MSNRPSLPRLWLSAQQKVATTAAGRATEGDPMPKFLCVQRSFPVTDDHKASPSDMQAMYAKFGEWMETYKANLVDPGGKVGDGKLVTDDKQDGPFVEVKELVGGYMIVEAADLAGAIEVAQACPGLVRPGSGVEVLEIHGPG
jgi:hypothetical protein